MMNTDPLLQRFQIKHLTLRNRVLSTAHAPSYAEDGMPKDWYRLYHEEKAKGGVALTMIGGSTNIAPDSPSVFGQLYAGDDSIIPWFQRLTEGVKSHGAAGDVPNNSYGAAGPVGDNAEWLPVIGPVRHAGTGASRLFPRRWRRLILPASALISSPLAHVYARAGLMVWNSSQNSHLIGQFLSPLVNRREDEYGGASENRIAVSL